jgi:B12-binding domain/radical SAM domain protein
MPDTRLALALLYQKVNHYSFNALAGAVDANPDLALLPIALAPTGDHLLTLACEMLRSYDRLVIALSVMTHQLEGMRQLVRQLRSENGSERIIIIAGGPHVTACAEDALNAGVDITFHGESELSFPDVLRCILAGREYHALPGISYLMNEKVVRQPRPALTDLDSFFSFSPKRGMLGPIEITRGCPFACSFCQTSRIFGVQLRHRSISGIVRQAVALQSGNRKILRLLSPNAFSYGSTDGRHLNLEAIRALLLTLREETSSGTRIIFGHFPSEVRPEHVTADTLDLLKEFADNDEIVLGAQSGSPRMLEACHRSHDVGSVVNAVALARKYGYKVIVDFIFGLPGEEESDRIETLKIIEELVHMGARIHPHAFAPLPQTPFAKAQPGHISPQIVQALEKFRGRRGVYETRDKTFSFPRISLV